MAKFYQFLAHLAQKKCYWSLLFTKFPHFPSVFIPNLVVFVVSTLAPGKILLKASKITALVKIHLDSISECLKQLHWLPVQQKIEFKLLVLMYKCLHGQPPAYLTELLQYNQPTRPGLCSSASKESYLQLSVLKTKCKTFADWSFSVGAPYLMEFTATTHRRSKFCAYV